MCDTLCVLLDDRTLFAKSSDRPVDEVQLVEAFPRRTGGGTLRTQHLSVLDAGASAFVGGQPTWLWGVEHGVNEHGVAIGNERVWTKDDPTLQPPALLGMDLVRLGLERGRTATAALDVITNLLEEHGQGGAGEEASGEPYFSSFLVADPTEAWILETSARTWAAARVDPRRERGASISNRLSLETRWDRSSRDVPPGANFQRWRDQLPTGHADRRRAATGAVACADPPPDAADLAAVLRHHGDHPWGAPRRPAAGAAPVAADPLPGRAIEADGTGVTVCMHLRGWEGTTGAMVASLPRDAGAPVRAWCALGNPCVGVFVPVLLRPDHVDDTAPALADPRRWHRFRVLSARVEAARDGDDADLGVAALEAVRAVLGPLEVALWEEADAAAVASPATWSSFAHGVGARLDAALDTLGVPTDPT